MKNLSEWFVNKSSIKIGDAIGFMRLWAILLNYMFVNATNQLTRRSHIQFKAFTHENKTRKRNVIVYYYDEDDIIPYIRLCSYRCCNFIRIWGELTWVWIHHVPLSNNQYFIFSSMNCVNLIRSLIWLSLCQPIQVPIRKRISQKICNPTT